MTKNGLKDWLKSRTVDLCLGWNACQNMCAHKNAFVLSRGIIGAAGETPKHACPLHKTPFSLETGACLSGDNFTLKVFPVQVVAEDVFVELPSQQQLEALWAAGEAPWKIW